MAGVSGYRGDPAAVFKSHGLVAKVTRNPTCAALGPKAIKLSITDGHCACALYHGGVMQERETAAGLRELYARRGWSQAKIARAVEARLESAGKKARSLASQNVFPETVAELLDGHAQLSLLAHMFAASFDSAFEIKSRATVSLADFWAGNFPEDTLLTVARAPA